MVWQELTANSKKLLLCCRLHLLGRFRDLINGPLHIERLLGDVIVLAFDDLLETLHRVRDFHVPARSSRELFGNVEWLRQEPLNLAGACNGQFWTFAQLVNAENRDDVLQILAGLQRLLNLLRDIVMLLANNARIENA